MNEIELNISKYFAEIVLKDLQQHVGRNSLRATGMTTACALRYISEAMSEYNTKIVIDHDLDEYGNVVYDINHHRKANVFNKVVELISKLELENFKINRHNRSIEYKPFVKINISVGD